MGSVEESVSVTDQRSLPSVDPVSPADGVLRKVLHVPADLHWFDGHFPGEPILAGVVQLKWAIEAAAQLVDAPGGVRTIQQLKFKLPIRPETTLDLTLERVDGGRAVVFRYRSAAGEHSSGRLVYGLPWILRPCVLIPHFNHEQQIPAVITGLASLGLPVIIIDDGSSLASFATLQQTLAGLPWVKLRRHESNRGKGAAVFEGLQLARERGYTHVVQIDADGQHRVEDVAVLLDLAHQHPDALVSGLPVYDASVPLARLHGRKLSVFWARVHTWSRDIVDPMCGFRVYPVARVLEVAGKGAPNSGMEFDTEIMVRAHWAGVPLLFSPTPITYPAGGVSHFRMFRDNVRISLMHTRLFFGMLRRIPALLGRRLRPKVSE